MRHPLYAAIKIIFLCTFYAVDAVCVILFWLASYKLDEHQLVSFIIAAKCLQFVTSGLISGVIGFATLYACSVEAEPGSLRSCQYRGPGMNAAFPLEFALSLVRTLLVWINVAIAGFEQNC